MHEDHKGQEEGIDIRFQIFVILVTFVFIEFVDQGTGQRFIFTRLQAAFLKSVTTHGLKKEK